MKKVVFLILGFLGFVVIVNAQTDGTAMTTVNTFAADVNYRKLLNNSSNNYYYLLNNKKVFGSPYLFNNWYKGVITMQDGKIYEQYVLRYNVFNQELNFKLGNDSLVVDTDVKSFTLEQNEDSIRKNLLFMHAKNFGDKKNNRFYEVLYENDYGTYLRFNKKVPIAVSNTIAIDASIDQLDYKFEYYYFNKVNKKIRSVNDNNGNWALLLNDEPFATSINLTEFEKVINSPDQVIVLLNKYKTFKLGK